MAGTSIEALRAQVEQGMRRGWSLKTVERRVIAHAKTDEERKAALWLYAWSFQRRLGGSSPYSGVT